MDCHRPFFLCVFPYFIFLDLYVKYAKFRRSHLAAGNTDSAKASRNGGQYLYSSGIFEGWRR